MINPNKKTLWMIAGGEMQIPAAYYVKKKGYNLIISDKNSKAPCRKFADEFFCIDIVDLKKNELVEKLFKNKLSGIFTIGSDAHKTVNYFAKRNRLHHTNLDVSKICKDKNLTRKFLKNKLPQPESYLISNYEDYIKKVKNFSRGYTLKQLNLSGSKGFYELKANEKLTKKKFTKLLNFNPQNKKIIIEEKLFPKKNTLSEMSTEAIWQDGKIIYFNCVDRIFSRDCMGYKNLPKSLYTNFKDGYEIGHINPSLKPKKEIQKIKKIMLKLGSLLGYNKMKKCHILKADIFFSENGPIILEMTPRLSGGYHSTGSSIVRGAKLSEAIIKICKGERFKKEELKYYFSNNNKTVLIISKYINNKRLFYITSGRKKINTLFKDIKSKIRKNTLLKNEKYFS
jgi:biotin carboxylase